MRLADTLYNEDKEVEMIKRKVDQVKQVDMRDIMRVFEEYN